MKRLILIPILAALACLPLRADTVAVTRVDTVLKTRVDSTVKAHPREHRK